MPKPLLASRLSPVLNWPLNSSAGLSNPAALLPSVVLHEIRIALYFLLWDGPLLRIIAQESERIALGSPNLSHAVSPVELARVGAVAVGSELFLGPCTPAKLFVIHDILAA